MKKYLLEEMTWEEAKEKFKEIDIAILPVGSLEQHGPHLPLSTDAFDVYWLAKEVCKKVREPKPIVLPPINYGISQHHREFVAISLSPETLINVVYDIGCSLAYYGIKKLLILNGHGGNIAALKVAAQKLTFEKDLLVFIDTGEIAHKEHKRIVKTKNDVHSGEYETSTSLYNREELVKKDKFVKGEPKFISKHLAFSSDEPIPWVFFTHKLSETGVLGDATKATKEKGEKLWQIHINKLSKFIEEIR